MQPKNKAKASLSDHTAWTTCYASGQDFCKRLRLFAECFFDVKHNTLVDGALKQTNIFNKPRSKRREFSNMQSLI